METSLTATEKKGLECDFHAIDSRVDPQTAILGMLNDRCIKQAAMEGAGTCYDQRVEVGRVLSLASPECNVLHTDGRGEACACVKSFDLLTVADKKFLDCSMYDTSAKRPVNLPLAKNQRVATQQSLRQVIDNMCTAAGGVEQFANKRKTEEAKLLASGKNDPTTRASSVVGIPVKKSVSELTATQVVQLRSALSGSIKYALVHEADGSRKVLNVTLDMDTGAYKMYNLTDLMEVEVNSVADKVTAGDSRSLQISVSNMHRSKAQDRLRRLLQVRDEVAATEGTDGAGMKRLQKKVDAEVKKYKKMKEEKNGYFFGKAGERQLLQSGSSGPSQASSSPSSDEIERAAAEFSIADDDVRQLSSGSVQIEVSFTSVMRAPEGVNPENRASLAAAAAQKAQKSIKSMGQGLAKYFFRVECFLCSSNYSTVFSF